MATPLLLLQADAPDFHIVDANEALLAIAGASREDLVGCGVFERFFPDPAHLDEATAATGRSIRASFERVLPTRAPDVMPVQRYDVARPDGPPEERYWRPTNTPIFEANGRLSRLAHHLQDVTSVVLLTRTTEAAEARHGRRLGSGRYSSRRRSRMPFSAGPRTASRRPTHDSWR